MLEWLSNKIEELKSCRIDTYFSKLEVSMQSVIDKCNRIERQLDAEVRLLTQEVAVYKGMLHSMAEAVPDMLWCKDLDGKYTYANSAIKNGLLFDDNPIGKTDIELASKAKEMFGDDNHTFGAKCANSDKIVLQILRPQRFLESGMIKGKMTYLEVFKAPYYVDGKVAGVVGGGRDMTEYVEALRVHDCSGCGKMKDIFSKYEYEG